MQVIMGWKKKNLFSFTTHKKAGVLQPKKNMMEEMLM